MEPTLEALLALLEKEYEAVQKEREKLLAERAEIDEQLRALDRRLDAAANYKATLEGKFTRPTRERKASAGTGTKRGSREATRQEIIKLLEQHPQGLMPNQITSVVTDNAVPNLLSQMKKTGQIRQPNKRGLYFMP
jgi:cell division septum initiation protein DivIVA